jgi:signal transduction histidine kinase
MGTTAYRCATAPIIIGTDVVGALTIGFAINEADIQTVRSMTNSEICLLVGNTPVITSFTREESGEIDDWIRTHIEAMGRQDPKEPEVIRIATSAGLYEAVLCALGEPLPASHRISFLIFRSVDREVQAALKPVIESFIILSIMVLIITAVIGFIISRGITRPIAGLVQGISEVSRGNYDYRINVGGGEELTFLARRFEEMSYALKEKVRQLAEQNAELENALHRLKETQQELVKSERLAATGKLTAQLSHEINNPVHNIQSCLQTVLKRMPRAGPERELLDVAYEEIERLARLTQQLLQVYRTSLVEEVRVPVCLNDVLREVISLSSESFRERNIVIKTNLDATVPPVVGSPDKLKQVFLNLFLNAKDAMPRGGTLSAETVRVNGKVVVSISDTGVGIPKENIHRIFDAFFTTKSKVSGVGLGLAVTYGIIKQHDGTITVKSSVGAGTLFTLTFPARTETAESV